jgi:hypothetical protein
MRRTPTVGTTQLAADMSRLMVSNGQIDAVGGSSSSSNHYNSSISINSTGGWADGGTSTADNQGPLPKGWERRVDQLGRIYYGTSVAGFVLS